MVRFLYRLAALVLACGAIATAAPTAAAGAGWSSACFAAMSADGPAAAAIGRVRTWDCAPHAATVAADRVVVRLPMRDPDGHPAAYIRTGIGRFAELTVIAEDASGTVRARSYRMSEVQPLVGEPQFTAALPRVDRPVAYYAVFDGASNRQGLSRTTVSSEPADGASSMTERLLLAMLIGILLVPTLFDLAVYKALRKAFFLWHAALSICMALLVGAWSGLLLEFVELSVLQWHNGLMVVIGLTISAASMFTRSFAAASTAGSWLSRGMSFVAGYSLVLTGLYLGGWLVQPVLGTNMFSLALAPVFLLLLANFVREYRLGDRAARMQVVGWLPLLVFFAVQIAADVTTTPLPQDGLPLLYLGVLVETVLSAFGVSLRFLEVRRERDRAEARAHVMGDLAERDHLTGLLNRRAIDNRFEDLRVRGYDTLALIDLDHFKSINDVSGHAVGDQVLEITARVLASDPDNIAVRLGGEEFLILLRGSDAATRAEKLRRMLSVRVVREVNGLEQIVTASMGLLSLPSDSSGALSFSSAYSRADLLLYEAKRDGRNRTKAAHWRFFEHEVEERVAAGNIQDRPAAVA